MLLRCISSQVPWCCPATCTIPAPTTLHTLSNLASSLDKPSARYPFTALETRQQQPAWLRQPETRTCCCWSCCCSARAAKSERAPLCHASAAPAVLAHHPPATCSQHVRMRRRSIPATEVGGCYIHTQARIIHTAELCAQLSSTCMTHPSYGPHSSSEQQGSSKGDFVLLRCCPPL
jgi:hypothetical protein